MAEIVGLNGLHNLEGFKCDLCGLTCDPQAQELNALDCTFSNCPSDASVYHQDCLEKYLKSIKLEKSRKTGFKCPRGCGKGSAFDQPCPGKITKSHPIHIRNDESKKRKKALPPPPLEYKPKTKEKGKEAAPNDKGKEAAKQKDSPQQDKGKAKAAAAAAPFKLRQVLPVHNAKTPAPSKQVEKQQIENIRREIAAKTGKATAGFAVSKPAVAKEKDLQTLHEYEAHKEASQPKMNAWGARNNAARVLNVPIHQPLPPPPPPPPPKPQPSVPVVSSWASAARLPVQAAASAKPKAAAVNGSVRAVSIWSTQQEHGDGQPPPPPPPKQKVTVLVGGELAEPEGPAKITKAQKKNLKRLERKALHRAATDTSVASSDIVSDFYPDTISEAENEVDTPLETRVGDGMSHLQSNDSREDDSGEGYSGSDSFEQQMSDHQRCLQALMATKARWLLGQLQVLGFPDWQCAVAVLRHGSNLHDGVAFLLEDHVTSEEQSRAYMASAVDSPDIDISEELQMLAEAQSCLGLPMSVLERAVADTDGDIQAAVEALLGKNGGLKADTLHSSHSEGPSHPQSRPSQAASQSDMKQRRSSADTTSSSSLPFPTSQPKPTEQSTIAPNVWGGQASQAQPHPPLPNDGHAGLNSWSPQQQSQQQHQQQQMDFSASAASYAAWHKQPADPSPFAAAALQPPPPPPKQAPPSPPLPRPVELPATLELPASLDPQLQLGLRDFVPAGSAGLLSTKLGQQYSDPTSSGFLKPTEQQQPQQQSEHADLPLGSRLSSYTSAASRSATPKANAESSSWNGSLDSSASYAAVQGLGQQMPSLSSFSMFSGPSGPAAGRAADLWGSLSGSSAQMASLERYNQLLQQSPGGASGRSSLDSSQAPFPGSSATAQRQAYLPSLSPGSTVSQASFNGYAASTPGQQQPASWGMLPMHSSAQSIWSSTPADRLGSDAPEAALFAAAAVAADVEPRRGDASGRDTSDADLELDSLMATLMCT